MIKTLLATREKTEPTARNLRLTIPHLGTITIIGKPAVDAQEVQSHDHSSLRIEQGRSQTTNDGTDVPTPPFGLDITNISGFSIPQDNAPFVSFTSNQYPMATPELPPWYQPAAAPYPFTFDDDLNVDVSGDWIFQDFT